MRATEARKLTHYSPRFQEGIEVIMNQIKTVAEQGKKTEVIFMNPLEMQYQTFLIEIGYTVEDGANATIVKWYDKPLTQSELEEIHKPVIVVSEIKKESNHVEELSNHPDYYPMCKPQQVQLDCRMEMCEFHVNGSCTNIAPAIKLYWDPIKREPQFTCYSGKDKA